MLIKGVTQAIENETESTIRYSGCKYIGEYFSRSGCHQKMTVCQSWRGFLILPHPLTNFEIQRCYQNGPKVKGCYSRIKLTKTMKDAAHIISLEGYK